MRVGDDGELIVAEGAEKSKRKRKSQVPRSRQIITLLLFPIVGSLGGFAINLAGNSRGAGAQTSPAAVCTAEIGMMSVAGTSVLFQPSTSYTLPENNPALRILLSMDGHSTETISMPGQIESLSLAADKIHVVESRYEPVVPNFFLYSWAIDSFGQNNLQVLTEGKFPSWSPDGKQIAFFRQAGYDSSALYVMNADGSSSRLIRKTRTISAPASWSPDSSQLVFGTTEFHGSTQNLYIIALKDDAEQSLVNSGLSAEYPSWSPDGKSIAYVSHDLYTISTDGLSRHNLTNGGFSYITSVGWSPDSKSLAFLARDKNNKQGIYVMDSDGAGLHSIFSSCSS